MTRRFRYALDPICTTGCALYALNQWLLKPHVASPFLRGHFNDVLLIPCALPIVLWLQRCLGLRGRDDFPMTGEVALHLAVWTFFAEWLGPHVLHHGVGDAWDAAAYGIGAVFALAVWRARARAAQ